MPSRIASMFLVLLTIGFFWFHYWSARNVAPLFVDTVAPQPDTDEMIAYNEFLILMDVGDEGRLNDVLTEFDLEVISPLGEWVHVARRESSQYQQNVALASLMAQENLEFMTRIVAHDAVHSAQLNYIQNTDTMFGCTKDMGLDNNGSVSDATVIPRDPYFRNQWHLSKETGVNLPGAWALTTGSENTVVALVDRNFDFSEDDLSLDRCEGRKYFYENILDYFPTTAPFSKADRVMHGSQVLSVIAPCTDNAVGISGVDWHAQVFAVDSKENASFSARLFGILWAAGIDVCSKSITGCPENSHFQKNLHPANVINASFGFAGDFLVDPPYGPVLDVIARVNRQGRTIVASAGNETIMADRRLPGAAGGVISVGSSNIMRQSSSFSNFGRTVDVNAPGENIMGLKAGRPISLNGTSFSAPIVSGIASLMLAANPLLSWKHIEYILKATASPQTCKDYCPTTMGKAAERACVSYCCDGDNVVCARGIVNAFEAVKMAMAGFPNVALVDIDDYYLALSDDTDLMIKVFVKNWGGKRALVRMRKTDRHLKLWPEILSVPPIDKDGVPGLTEVTVYYDAVPEKSVVLSLLLEAANEDQPNIFNDRIEAIVAIEPDPKQPTKKLLRELLPKR